MSVQNDQRETLWKIKSQIINFDVIISDNDDKHKTLSTQHRCTRSHNKYYFVRIWPNTMNFFQVGPDSILTVRDSN